MSNSALVLQPWKLSDHSRKADLWQGGPERQDCAGQGKAPTTALVGPSERLHIESVDGVIVCLSLENYQPLLSPLSPIRNCAFGIANIGPRHLSQGLTAYKFHSGFTDVAETLTERSKP
jgi:hypothetical protein